MHIKTYYGVLYSTYTEYVICTCVDVSATYKNNSWILVHVLCDELDECGAESVALAFVFQLCVSRVSSLERFGSSRSMKIRNVFIVYVAEK